MREQKEKADAVMDVISSAGTSLTFIYDLSEGSKLHFRFDLDRSIFFVERYQLNIIFVLLIFFNISVTVQIEDSDIAIFQLVLRMNPYDENYLH